MCIADTGGRAHRFSDGGCGGSQDASLLSVRGHGQHSVTYGKSRNSRQDSRLCAYLPVSELNTMYKITGNVYGKSLYSRPDDIYSETFKYKR